MYTFNQKLSAMVFVHYTSHSNSTEAAKLLLDRGADPNARNKKGLTPTHCAVQRCHSDVLKVLMAHPKIEIAAQASQSICHMGMYV